MIDYIKGELTELNPTYAVVEAAGVGYDLNISLTAYAALEGMKQVKLLVHEVIREDAHLLFGFIEERERVCFALLSEFRVLEQIQPELYYRQFL